MPRLLLAKATSLVVAGEGLYLDFVDVEEASSPTPSVAEEGGVGSVGGDEDFSCLPWLLSGFHRVEWIWGFLGRAFVTAMLAWSFGFAIISHQSLIRMMMNL